MCKRSKRKEHLGSGARKLGRGDKQGRLEKGPLEKRAAWSHAKETASLGGGGADGARTTAFVLSESDDTGSSVSFDGKLRAMADVTPLPCTESEKGPRTTTHRVGCPRAAMRMDRDASGQERTTSRVGCPLLLLSPSTWVGSLHLGRPVVVVLCSVMASSGLGEVIKVRRGERIASLTFSGGGGCVWVRWCGVCAPAARCMQIAGVGLRTTTTTTPPDGRNKGPRPGR
jgi:hypothetical protein